MDLLPVIWLLDEILTSYRVSPSFSFTAPLLYTSSLPNNPDGNSPRLHGLSTVGAPKGHLEVEGASGTLAAADCLIIGKVGGK